MANETVETVGDQATAAKPCASDRCLNGWRGSATQPHGSIWLGVTAAGLLAFGIYELAEGAFGRIIAPSLRQTAVKGGLAG